MSLIRLSFLVLLFAASVITVYAQNDTINNDTLKKNKEEKIKTGWTFGAVPAVAYDSDIGFKGGAVVNFYHFGDGSTYPQYLHSLYLEYSMTTKGSGIAQFTYDSKYLIPGIRVSAEASYLTERALDFYGFNGYEALYDQDYEDDSPGNNKYKSRLYYRQERKLLRLRSDFQGKITGDEFKWLAGLAHYSIHTDTVDINRLNKGKDEEDKLPAIGGGLYGNYVDWGVIPEDQVKGGNTTIIKAGLIYDTRDNEPNPMNGIWTEAQVILAPSILGNGDYAYSRFAVTHRQYFTLVPRQLSLACRLSYQAKLSGTMPYYMLPFVFNTAPSLTRDGLGGAKTLRGILRNRIVGEDFFYGNLELRWKFLRTVVLNQNLYIALSAFTDMGQVTGKYDVELSGVPESSMYLFPDDKEKLNVSYGVGLHFALNENFVVAVDYGRAADPRDGISGLYIGLNFLY